MKEGINCNSVFLSEPFHDLSPLKPRHWECPGYFCLKAKTVQWNIYFGKFCNLSFSPIIHKNLWHSFTWHLNPGPEVAVCWLSVCPSVQPWALAIRVCFSHYLLSSFPQLEIHLTFAIYTISLKLSALERFTENECFSPVSSSFHRQHAKVRFPAMISTVRCPSPVNASRCNQMRNPQERTVPSQANSIQEVKDPGLWLSPHPVYVTFWASYIPAVMLGVYLVMCKIWPYFTVWSLCIQKSVEALLA